MKILNKLFDAVFIIFISTIISSCIVIYLNTNKTSLFGYNIVTVLSDSMSNSSINVNDKVIIKDYNILELEVGDIICFNTSNSINNNYEIFIKDNYNNNVIDYIDQMNNTYINTDTSIWIHQITNIYIDDDYNIYFETKGTSNNYTDTYLVKSSDVIGKYIFNSVVLTNLYKFGNTSIGKYVLIVLPSTFFLMYMIYICFRLYSILEYQKKVMNLQIFLTNKSINKDIIYKLSDKQKYQLLTYYEDKEYCAKLLWQDNYKKKLEKKDTL